MKIIKITIKQEAIQTKSGIQFPLYKKTPPSCKFARGKCGLLFLGSDIPLITEIFHFLTYLLIITAGI